MTGPRGFKAKRKSRGCHPATGTTCSARGDECRPVFQSAPRSPDRGDILHRGLVHVVALFQSALRSPDRSDAASAVTSGTAPAFQSALRSPDRSDGAVWRGWWWWICFNPRSGHPTGATQQALSNGEFWASFNPRSGHPTGATGVLPV